MSDTPLSPPAAARRQVVVERQWFLVTTNEVIDGDGYHVTEEGDLIVVKGLDEVARYRVGTWSRVRIEAVRREEANA